MIRQGRERDRNEVISRGMPGVMKNYGKGKEGEGEGDGEREREREREREGKRKRREKGERKDRVEGLLLFELEKGLASSHHQIACTSILDRGTIRKIFSVFFHVSHVCSSRRIKEERINSTRNK